jgi:hypothetical protein
MSRSLITGIVATILILASLAVIFYYKFIRVKDRAAIEAVPNDAAIILEATNLPLAWHNLKSTDFWSDLQHNEAIANFTSKLSLIDSVIKQNNALSSLLNEERSILSFHKSGNGNIEVLWVLETGGALDMGEISRWLSQVTSTRVRKRSFEKDEVFDFIPAGSAIASFSIAIKDRLFLLAHDGSLVEEGLRKLRYKIPENTSGLQQAVSLAKAGAQLNVYINYNTLPSFLSVFTKAEKSSMLHFFKSFANWSVLDVSFDKERFGITGVTFTDDSLFQFLDLFKTQEPVNISFENYLPRNTAFALMLGMSDYTRFNADLNEYLQANFKLQGYIDFNDSLENRYEIDIARQLISFAGKKAALFMTEPTGDAPSGFLMAAVQFTNPQQVQQVLQGYIQAIDKRGEGDSVSFSHNGIPISRVKLGNFLKLIYGNTFEHISNPFYFIKDDVFYFVNDLNAMKLLIEQVNSGNVLAADSGYMAFTQTSSAMANVALYISPPRLQQFPSYIADNEFFSAWNRYQYDFKKAEYLAIQFAATGNKAFYTNVNFSYNASFSEGNKVMWMLKLDTCLLSAPQVLFNSALNQNCILAQDANKTLYYINNSGTILWRTRFNELILGDVHSVDFYQNGKMQYLFQTISAVYLIDENGHNMPGYPVRLPGKASAPLSLFDFYGDSLLSYFIPLENKRIMGYQLSGKPLQGWNPKSIDDKIAGNIQYTSRGEQRIIYATGQKGKLYAFQLKGGVVELPKEWQQSIFKSVYLNFTDSLNAYAVITDTASVSSHAQLQNDVIVSKRLISTSIKPQTIRYFNLANGLQYMILKSPDVNLSVIDMTSMPEKETQYISSDTFPLIPTWKLHNEQFIMMRDAEGLKLTNLNASKQLTIPLYYGQTIGLGDLYMDRSACLIYTDAMNNLILYKVK